MRTHVGPWAALEAAPSSMGKTNGNSLRVRRPNRGRGDRLYK